MSVPVWMVLGFATWTLVLLLGTVGVYRWSHILTRRVPISEFRADRVEGEDWYKRAVRAHANCVENLPVFGAIVFALYAGHVSGPTVDSLATIILATRIAQSVVHVGLEQTNTIAFVRFLFFFAQVASFFWLIAILLGSVPRAG